MTIEPRSQVILQDPFVEWYSCSESAFTVYSRGFTYIDDRLYEGKELTAYVAQQCTDDVAVSQNLLNEAIPHWDVGWALVVVWSNGSVFAAVDRVRSIPLLYSTALNRLIITARIETMRELVSTELDSVSALEYLTFGNVTGDRTLSQNIFQIQAGEILKFNSEQDQQPSLERYFLYLPLEPSKQSFASLQDELTAIFERCFQRLASQLDGEPIIVPLSGGLDSRLTAAMLKKVGYENVICFSYGRDGNSESKISQAVAESLGYRWEYLEYTPQIWQQRIHTDKMREFWQYCANGISIPSIKQLPAATAVLNRLNLHPGDRYLFFPGYCLDVPAGSLVTYAIDNQKSLDTNLVQEILKINSHLPTINLDSLAPELQQELYNRIEHTYQGKYDGSQSESIAGYEQWIFENRLSRFAVNTLRIHDYLGGRWRMLWDNPITDFFLQVPLKYRYGKKLYASVLQERIFTDSASELATIPLAKIGQWNGRQGIGLPSKSRLLGRSIMKRMGILNQYYKYKKSTVLRKKPDLNETYWFTDGIDPNEVSVQDVLDRQDAWTNIPPELHPLLAEFSELKVNEAPAFFLLAAISLSASQK